MTTVPTRRRWFRYSLRTLFLLVAVFAVFLAYHLNWIRQRHGVLAAEEASIAEAGVHIWMLTGEDPESSTPHPAPILLRLFGEPGAACIAVKVATAEQEKITESDLARAQRYRTLFPEADVRFWNVQRVNLGDVGTKLVIWTHLVPP